MKKLLSLLTCLVLLFSIVSSVPVSAASSLPTSYWASQDESSITLFTYAPDYGVPDPLDVGIQICATESFSNIVFPLAGKGSLTFKIYSWYYNYDATIAQEPLRSIDFEVSKTDFYVIPIETLPAGEYVILITNPEATSHIGVFGRDELNEDAQAEFYHELETYGCDYIVGGLRYDRAPTTVFGAISQEKQLPTSSPDADATPEVEPTKTPVATSTPTATKTPQTTQPSSDSDGGNNGTDNGSVVLYVILAVAVLVILGAVIFIVIKRKKK